MKFKWAGEMLKIIILILLILVPDVIQASEIAAADLTDLISKNKDQLIFGPKTIDLGDQAIIDINEHQAFVTKDLNNKMLSLLALPKNNTFIGGILNQKDGQILNDSFVGIYFEPIGYVDDRNAKSWDYDLMLNRMRASIDFSNRARELNGRPEQEFIGWIDRPRYEVLSHKITWSAKSQDKNNMMSVTMSNGQILLGREGVLFFVLASKDNVMLNRINSESIQSSIHFKNGKRYEDYQSNDKVYDVTFLSSILNAPLKDKFTLLTKLIALFIVLGGILRFKHNMNKKT